MNESQATIVSPITHFSKSSLLLLLRNPLMFKMQYMLGIFSDSNGMSALVGRACHEALKAYYGANDTVVMPHDEEEAQELSTTIGKAYLEQWPDESIRYGKTGNRATMYLRYENGMDFYFANKPIYKNVIMAEKKLSKLEVTTRYGQKLPLKVTAIPDLVHELEDGQLEVIDTKFTTAFTSFDEEDAGHLIEASFLKHAVEAATGKKVKQVSFFEIKVTKNNKCTEARCFKEHDEKMCHPQTQSWICPDHEPYDIAFYNIFKDACKFVQNPNAIYLPNPSDMFDGNEAWNLYLQGLINADMDDVEVRAPVTIKPEYFNGVVFDIKVDVNKLDIPKKKSLKEQRAQLIEDNPNAKITYNKKTKQFTINYKLSVDAE